MRFAPGTSSKSARTSERTTFAEFAQRYEADYLPGRNLKPSTLLDYGGALRRHLVPWFGHLPLSRVEAADVDAYIAAQTAAGLSPRTISNHLGLLRVVFKVARRWRLVASNPLEEVEAPRPEHTEMQVLTEARSPGS